MEDTDLNWRKSSYSSNGGADCVEIGSGRNVILIRDTKQAGTSPMLTVSASAWARFTDGLKDR